MKVRNLIPVFLPIVYSSLFIALNAQTRKIDSLRHVLKIVNRDDTNKVNAINGLAFALYYINPDTTILLTEAANTLAVKLGFKSGQALSLNIEGIATSIKGDNSKSLDFYQKSLTLYRELNDRSRIAGVLSNIGLAYGYQSEHNKALEYDLEALKIDEELSNKKGQATLLTNIGLLYCDRGELTKALDYGKRSLKLGEELGSKRNQSIALNLIGNVYLVVPNYPEALSAYTRCIKLDEELGDDHGKAISTGNVGDVYYEEAIVALKENDISGSDTLFRKALVNDLEAEKIEEVIGDKTAEGNLMSNIGSIYIKLGNYKVAENYLKKAVNLDSLSGAKDYLVEAEQDMSVLYDTLRQYKSALLWFKRAMVLKDTMFNEEKNKALTRKELTYEFDKKQAAEKAEQNKKDALTDADKRKQRIVIWATIGGLFLVLVFAGFILRSLRITRKQKQIIEIKNIETEKQKVLIELQKITVEEKNKDITDSINYAKRLQDAILPPLSLIKQYLPESFLLYKPKDIVAGDFYWMERLTSLNFSQGRDFERSGPDMPSPLGEGKDEVILIAAADCTGHGVPGALVSVVCSNALNRTVKEFKITEPGKILDKVRELVLETFEKSEDNVQDGMDISLCCMNTKTSEVQWSGANNALWYIQNGELKEVTPNKQPIGKYYNATAFNTHSLKLSKGDSLYLFTDGYADQFGGPKGKKFKYAQFSDKLKAISNKRMEEQKSILLQAFEEWQGGLEQVDDVLVIGIRV
jgi:serine phosphatase RsbU (regulator of sigma subunit)